jgi:hypothetical protein
LKTNYILIDYENVQVRSLAFLQGEQFRVRVFLGPTNTKIPVEFVVAMQDLGERAEYIVLEASGPNALDFHIAYYLGIFTSTDPSGFFHIISRDTGFDPLIKHLKARKIAIVRSASIEEMPCFNKITASGAIDMKDAHGDGKPISKAVGVSLNELVKVAVDDLIKRKASKPRTLKTLKSTIYSKCGKGLSSADVDAIYEALVKRGYVKIINGQKVTYAFPVAQP